MKKWLWNGRQKNKRQGEGDDRRRQADKAGVKEKGSTRLREAIKGFFSLRALTLLQLPSFQGYSP